MGKALLEHNIAKLKSQGIEEIILCTCYLPDSFTEYFAEHVQDIPIRFVQEETPLGTGGAIKNVQQYIGNEPFLVFNADIISDIDVRKMREFHEEKGADVTIATVYVDDPTPYGVIEYDANDYAVTFKEKPKPHEVLSHQINAGAYIFNPAILKKIPPGKPVSVEREVFPKLLAEGKRIAVYRECSYWMDLCTPEKYLQVHWDIFAGKYAFEGLDFNNTAIVGLSNARVHVDAVLRGPVWLGEDVRIESGAVVGPNVVVGPKSYIGKKCTIDNSILWGHSRIEANCRVSNSVIMRDCLVKQGSKIFRYIFSPDLQKRIAVSY